MDKLNIIKPIIVIMLLYSVDAFIVGLYCIKAMSMVPTLFSGDLAIVKKVSYGFINKRGSIIVVRYPFKASNYIKRLLGLPGDIVTYNKHIKKISINYIGIINYIQKLKDQKKNILYSSLNIHSRKGILINKPKSNICCWCLPRFRYFVIGDYIVKSYDSRFWGTFPGKQVIGCVIAIWENFF
ncbi:signal peptidase I [Candidatus Tremblaya phenacola]|uniref:Signal peptidase I n=1 Tax=Candidatus Tremblayella phenacoccinincola TaxID=1010676 RepID=A0A2G0V7B5_9PROT|nr:signal peptidase I [Candidatus Tremblaya phenacola]PHN16365.1 Signal peptidase I [Candidatus Tremblaya phenacola]